MTQDITCAHFQPCCNGWEVITLANNTARISDTASAGAKYLNQSKKAFVAKLGALAIGTPTVGLFANCLEGCGRAFRLISFSHFWKPQKDETERPKKQPYVLMDFSPLSHKLSTMRFLHKGILLELHGKRRRVLREDF